MTRIKSSTAWIVYYLIYFAGFAGLMYLTRALPIRGIVLWLPFALPVVLLVILAFGAYAEEYEPPREAIHTTILGRVFARIGPRLRTYPMVALTMVNPVAASIYPARAGTTTLRTVFEACWYACALIAWIAVPRLVSADNRRPLPNP